MHTHGIVMICDEVMAGFGRTGEWFACQHWDVEPDLIACAKGINSGYVPLGALLISRRIADTFMERAYMGGLTYSGHPLACAAAVASIEAFKEEGIIENAASIGERGARAGAAGAEGAPPVDRRGARQGLLLGRRAGQEPRDPRDAGAVQRVRQGHGRRRRLPAQVLGARPPTMVHWNVLMVVPPLEYM